MKKCDLLVVIRCHAMFDFVVDTYQAAKYYCGPSTEVVFAVDGGQAAFAERMISTFGHPSVYVSSTHWNWGAGLFCLLVESINYFSKIYSFNHFQSIDYDSLYIASGCDEAVLSSIDSSSIGLLGCHNKNNAHWRQIFNKTRPQFELNFEKVPDTYIPGEGVQGGFMTLTRSLIDAMAEKGMLQGNYARVKLYTSIADDHLLPIFVRMCGLTIRDVSDFARCSWRAREDPRGIEKKGWKIFHPVKLAPHNKCRSTEVEIRNYFREVRGAPDKLR